MIPRRRWRIAWLLGLGVLVNYMDRVNLSVSEGALHSEFGISKAMFGILLGAYSWPYAALQMPMGILLDRLGVQLVGRLSTLLWSIASFAASLAGSIGALIGARLLLGVGEAPTFPANAKAVAFWFPTQERSLATALFDAASKLGAAVGAPLIGVILIRCGWRISFAVTGFISLAYCVLFHLVYRNPSADPRLDQAERRYISEGGAHEETSRFAAEGASLFYLLGRRKIIGLSLGFAAYNYTFYLLLTWLPSYLSYSLGIDLLHSVVYTSVPWLIAACSDLVVGGYLVDWMVKRGHDPSRVRKFVLVSGTAAGLAIFGAAYAHSVLVAIVCISIALGGLSAAAPVGWSIPALIAPRNSVGRVGGIMNFCCQLSAISAPLITGYVVSETGSFFGAFAVAGAFTVIGIMSYVYLLGAIEPVAEMPR